jgi:hypothetical protein
MALKDLLLALTSYPNTTSTSAIDQAIAFAELVGARISAVTFEMELPEPIGFYTDALLGIADRIAAEQQKSVMHARDLLNAFESTATRQGVFYEQLLERCIASEVPDRLIEHARLHDLTITPVRDGDNVEQWYAEAVIFGSGRPILILPEVP